VKLYEEGRRRWRALVLCRFEQLKVERTQAQLDEHAEMTSLVEKLHRFIYDDICEVEGNIMVGGSPLHSIS